MVPDGHTYPPGTWATELTPSILSRGTRTALNGGRMGAQPSCPLSKKQQQQLRGEQRSGLGHTATAWEATLAVPLVPIRGSLL